MRNEGPLIGRDSELQVLDAALRAGRPGLLLCTGGPQAGKRRMLRELRARASVHHCALVPEETPPDGDGPWLVVDKETSIDAFRVSIERPHASEGNSQADLELVLVYGYRPEEDFHLWFTQEFVAKLKGPKDALKRRLIIIAASADDVEALKPLADGEITLGALPQEAVTDELRRINDALDDRMDDAEIAGYADAIVAHPSLLDPLRQVLSLTSARTAAAVEED